MNNRITAIAIVISIVCFGCARATFVGTHSFQPGPGGPPAIYTDRDPIRPHKMVGFIAVNGMPSEVDDLSVTTKEAAEKAQEVGCDLIRFMGGTPGGEKRFACGIWTTNR